MSNERIGDHVSVLLVALELVLSGEIVLTID